MVDASGAAVPNALIRLTALSSPQAVRTAMTNQDGAFGFAPLGPDDYEIVVDAPYFSVERRSVRVDSGPIEVSLALQTGRFSESLSVVGTRLGDSPATLRRLPGALTILDAATLAGSQVFTATEALRKVPGVNVRDEEGLGLRPNIGVRGLNPTRSSKVLLLEDGVPFTIAPYGDNASYYHPPIERFESVEVLKGSGQIAYGPVTVGGIVNYVTPDVPKRTTAMARLAFGSRDYANVSGFAGTTAGRVGMSLDYMRKQGNGARDNVRSRLDDVSAKVHVSVTDAHSVTVKANYYGEDSTVTYSGLTEAEWAASPRQNPFTNDAFVGARTGVTATWKAQFGGGLQMTTNVYQSSFNRDWWRQSSNSGQRPNRRPDPACGGMANLLTTCGNEGRLRQYDFWGVEPRFRAMPTVFGVTSETDFGVRVHAERQDRLQKNGATPIARDGVLVESNLRENAALSGFVQNRFLLGRLTVTPGLRVEEIRYRRTNRLTAVGGNTSLTQWLPGIGAAFAPSAALTIFGGLHRGFAPPRTEDVISDTTGAVVELDSERSWDTEAGVRYTATGLSAEATFFQMNYQNQIVPASLAGGVGATLTNGGKTLHQGVELGLRADSAGLIGGRHNIFTRVAYTALPTARFTGIRYSSVAGFSQVPVTNNRLPYAPDSLLAVTIGYQHPVGFDAQVETVRVSDQFGDDLNTVVPSADGQRGLIPGYIIWNAAANWAIARLHSSVFVTVKNVGDTLYIADRSRGLLPGVPRLLQGGVRVRF
ncbi:MAG: TonB-dependent receptor [Cyanobacteria bacterium]|nr:TonB-dependent receptor [Cyanobacteriota bacterium]